MRAGSVAVALMLGAACSGGNNVTGGGGGGGGGVHCSGTNASPAVCDNLFSPDTIFATAGRSVTWTWKGRNIHNVTFLSGPTSPARSAVQDSGSFTSESLSPGTYTYECSVHSVEMSGTIVVH